VARFESRKVSERVGNFRCMSRFEINPNGIAELQRQVQANVAAHLNAVVSEVTQSHSGQAVDVVKAEICRRANTKDFTLGDDDSLQLVAEAIHRGEQPPSYRG
jgi:hypothetical protein